MMEKMQEIRLFSRKLIHRTTKEYKIPAQHLDLLSQLALSKKSMTPMELSKIMEVNKTVISRIIDKLSEGGYLIKAKDQNDKRSYSISITDLGIEEIDKIYTYYLEPIYKLRKKLGDEEFFELMFCIERANAKLNED
ncbi:MarR family transcriptional regulator [Romboutsia weinsteinii]|uniref:MarR family transcriptional regulator n=1 Tax=Romboutsia weinsteinii TaxID=2020949 RepID=A0A371J6G9_9FIRM|nr:MarR family transcriptional regulator [Romboutsia weinsteinii]RDY28266.1 MarR family transcriptional regulator [Romboutsia weinsteinii]